ncbi:MAG: hypothetical protein H3C43_04665 [Leptonema sp. (in: Bacteria)]|nr:hypothetical protein [Leptonema sp. (in: bacteria)]
MQDNPKAEDLLEAVQDFLMKELLPQIRDNDALSYKALVSWNMLGVISREIKLEEEIINREIHNVGLILGQVDTKATLTERRSLLNHYYLELCKKIQSERLCDPNSLIWKTVKQSVVEKLKIANPRFQVETE